MSASDWPPERDKSVRLDGRNEPIHPTPNYGNAEGASAPDRRASVVGDAAVNTGLGAVSDPRLRWDCGHLTTEHPRAEAARCRDARVHRTGDKRSARDIATEAARLVGGDRAVAHGDMSVNFANTAAIWNALLEAKARQQSISTPRLTALDVPNFLEAFKIARRYSGSHNIDDYIDGAGYAACAGEIAEKMSHGD